MQTRVIGSSLEDATWLLGGQELYPYLDRSARKRNLESTHPTPGSRAQLTAREPLAKRKFLDSRSVL